jgi:hypothetical protein
METKTTHGFKIISQSHPTDGQLSPAQTSGIQRTLFPLRSCRSLIFVSLPDVDYREFVSILESAGPLVIVELRRIPRFDLGPLNRQSIFDLFRRLEDVYLDLGTEEAEGLNGADFSLKVQRALQRYVQQQRPFLFLTSTTQNPPALSKSIFEWLQKSNEDWEIYEVPHHGAKWAAGFIA